MKKANRFSEVIVLKYFMNYRVEEKSTQEIYEEYKRLSPNIDDDSYYFGLTLYAKQTIYINKDLPRPQKEKALRHEFCHCFLWENGFGSFESFSEEQVCDIVAACCRTIEFWVNEYFEGERNYE